MTTATPTPERMRQSVAPFLSFFGGHFARLNGNPDVANFAVGNPQEMPLTSYVEALQKHVAPLDKDWFAYKLSEPASQRTVAETLRTRTGLDWDPADVAMTNGGFAAIAVALRTLVRPGDEVVFLSPPWFFYELLILVAGGEPVRVRLDPPAFDLDVDRIAAAITPRTRMVLVNSPHNPTGRIFPRESLSALASALTDASERIGHPIWILSDEPYNRIAFDGAEVPSPAELYPHTVVTYSYGKQLLAPGMRIGYLAIPPTCPERRELRDEIFISQFATGYAFPNALLQHALADLERLSIDIGALQARRDRLVPALREMGYEASMPAGHLLHDGALTDRRRRRLRRGAGPPQRARPPRHRRRGSRLVPGEPDRLGCHGRVRHPALRRRARRGRRTKRDGVNAQRLNFAIFVAIALIGGGNPVGVAILVDELDPLWAAAVRFIAAGAIFALGMVLFRIPVPHGRALAGSLLYGALGFFAAFTCLFWGLQETPPGTGQVIIALVPLLTLGFAIAHGLERFSLRALIGALVALGGLAFLVNDRIEADVPLISLLAMVAGAVFLAESGVILKLTPRAHPVASNAVGMLAGSVGLLALSAVVGDTWRAYRRSRTRGPR